MAKALLHELGKSLSFGRISLLGKVLWPMLLSSSDDQGRGLAEPDAIKWYVCPNVDELTVDTIPGVLAEMEAQGMIQLYTDTRGRQIYQAVRWWEYQQLAWARPSRYEAPDGWADRIRYQKQGSIIKENWGPEEKEPTPELPSDLPSDLPSGVNQPNSTQPNSKESAADAAPQPEPEPEKPKRQSTRHDIAKTELETHFSNITGIPKPSTKTAKQKSAAAVRWWNPLGEIAHLVDDDVGAGTALISAAVAAMDAARLTFDAPQSILKTVISEFGRRRRDPPAVYPMGQRPEDFGLEPGVRFEIIPIPPEQVIENARLRAEECEGLGLPVAPPRNNSHLDRDGRPRRAYPVPRYPGT